MSESLRRRQKRNNPSFASSTPATETPKAPEVSPEERCCRFYGIGNTIYKGRYLPSADEYETHGYDRHGWQKFIEESKQSIDKQVAVPQQQRS